MCFRERFSVLCANPNCRALVGSSLGLFVSCADSRRCTRFSERYCGFKVGKCCSAQTLDGHPDGYANVVVIE